jgi:hypothetical protein
MYKQWGERPDITKTGNSFNWPASVYIPKLFNMVPVLIKDAPDIGGPDNPAFLISGIRPDIGFDLPDIRKN